MASRRIEDLHPKMQPLARAFQAEAERLGLDFIFTCTYRSGARFKEFPHFEWKGPL